MDKGGFKATFFVLLPLSLVAGFMVAGIGTAMWPPVSAWAAPLICSGTVDVQSDYYTPPGGGSGVSRHIMCVSGAGKDAAADEITFSAIGIAGLLYAAIAFVLLQIFAAPRMRRGAAEARASVTDFGGGISARGVASPAELQAILGQVSESLRRGEADVTMRNVTIDGVTIDGAEGGDAGERLGRLRQLHDAGLISDRDYEAKKAEILSGL
jgi:hypothetical protein